MYYNFCLLFLKEKKPFYVAVCIIHFYCVQYPHCAHQGTSLYLPLLNCSINQFLKRETGPVHQIRLPIGRRQTEIDNLTKIKYRWQQNLNSLLLTSNVSR